MRKPEEEMQIEVVNPEAVVIETEDGGVVIDFEPESDSPCEEFGSNLADFMEEDALNRLSSEIVGAYLSDKASRHDWEETYIKGLKQLGLKI